MLTQREGLDFLRQRLGEEQFRNLIISVGGEDKLWEQIQNQNTQVDSFIWKVIVAILQVFFGLVIIVLSFYGISILIYGLYKSGIFMTGCIRSFIFWLLGHLF